MALVLCGQPGPELVLPPQVRGRYKYVPGCEGATEPRGWGGAPESRLQALSLGSKALLRVGLQPTGTGWSARWPHPALPWAAMRTPGCFPVRLWVLPLPRTSSFAQILCFHCWLPNRGLALESGLICHPLLHLIPQGFPFSAKVHRLSFASLPLNFHSFFQHRREGWKMLNRPLWLSDKWHNQNTNHFNCTDQL